MATLHVQDVPEELYARLLRRAQLRRRSLDVEVIELLEWAMVHVDRGSVTVLSPVHNLHRGDCAGRRFDSAEVGTLDSTTLLREDRDR